MEEKGGETVKEFYLVRLTQRLCCLGLEVYETKKYIGFCGKNKKTGVAIYPRSSYYSVEIQDIDDKSRVIKYNKTVCRINVDGFYWDGEHISEETLVEKLKTIMIKREILMEG